MAIVVFGHKKNFARGIRYPQGPGRPFGALGIPRAFYFVGVEIVRMNRIEKLYAANCLKQFGEPRPALSLDVVRGSMKRIAHHEGGHFAADCFTEFTFSLVTEISILGNENAAGYVRSEMCFSETSLDLWPSQMKRSYGYMLLLKHLAGSGAEMLLDKSEDWRSIFDYHDSVYGDDCYGDREEGTDLFKAEQIAHIMSKPFMPWYRILSFAEKWTLEMLRIPSVWRMVETVAGKLMRKGELFGKDLDILFNIARRDDFQTIDKLPKWRRRGLFL